VFSCGTHRLYYVNTSFGNTFIVDTGGSRDILQDNLRFLPGSLCKLHKSIPIHMASGAVHATHIGVIKYCCRAPEWYSGGACCFSWLSLGLYVPKMEKNLAIMSVPSHRKLGVSLKVEGDFEGQSVDPYIHATGQTVHGMQGATFPKLEDNGPDFRGVSTTSTSTSNMMMLEVISETEIKRSSLLELDLHTGKPFEIQEALKRLRVLCPQIAGFSRNRIRSRALVCIDQALTEQQAVFVNTANSARFAIVRPDGHTADATDSTPSVGSVTADKCLNDAVSVDVEIGKPVGVVQDEHTKAQLRVLVATLCVGTIVGRMTRLLTKTMTYFCFAWISSSYSFLAMWCAR